MNPAAPPPVRQIMRPCSRCPALNCQIHRSTEERVRRGTTTERGYDGDWETVRAAKLATDPICEIRSVCQGMVASQVHHVETIKARPNLRLEWSNLRSICGPCHRQIHRKR